MAKGGKSFVITIFEVGLDQGHSRYFTNIVRTVSERKQSEPHKQFVLFLIQGGQHVITNANNGKKLIFQRK